MLAEEARSGCPTGGWIEFVISLQTRSDILQGQALFKGGSKTKKKKKKGKKEKKKKQIKEKKTEEISQKK